jgi:hypothetical protein
MSNSGFLNSNVLDFSGKNLTSVPEISSNVCSLFLSNNDIQNINFLPPNVKYLDISFNPIKSLDFIKKSKVNVLIMQGVKNIEITEIPDTLIILDCSFCNLKKLPFLKNVSSLKCKGNKLKNLDLNNVLTSLDASKNLITKINFLPDTLKYLNISHNKLENIPDLNENIEILNLSHNKFDINNLPILPSKFMFHGMSKYIFDNNKNYDEQATVTFFNGQEIIINEDIRIEEYLHYDNRKLDKNKEIKCLDIIMGEEYNIEEFLKDNSNNIIINVNNILYGYRRTDLMKHINTMSDIGYVNQIFSKACPLKYYKLYMREYINEIDFTKILDKKYSVYVLKTSEFKIFFKGNHERSYDVEAYTLKDFINKY